MHLTEYFVAVTQTISLGANAKSQALKFAICLAAGVVLGVVALLYFRRSSKAETFVTDLFATLVLGGGYIGCLEFVFDGKFEPYGLVAYLVGTSALPFIYRLVKNRKAKKTQNLS